MLPGRQACWEDGVNTTLCWRGAEGTRGMALCELGGLACVFPSIWQHGVVAGENRHFDMMCISMYALPFLPTPPHYLQPACLSASLSHHICPLCLPLLPCGFYVPSLPSMSVSSILSPTYLPNPAYASLAHAAPTLHNGDLLTRAGRLTPRAQTSAAAAAALFHLHLPTTDVHHASSHHLWYRLVCSRRAHNVWRNIRRLNVAAAVCWFGVDGLRALTCLRLFVNLARLIEYFKRASLATADVRDIWHPSI